MTDKIPQVYVIQGRGPRDYADLETVLAQLPARVTVLPFITAEEEVIARARDADALVVTYTPVGRKVMSALADLKVVVRTGVGYDVIDIPAATELGVIAVNIPDLWVREVANHTMGLLLAWNRKLITLDHNVRAGSWGAGIPGAWTGSLYGETVGIVGLGNIGSAFARRVAAFETRIIAHDPYVADAHFKALGVERVSLEALARALRLRVRAHAAQCRDAPSHRRSLFPPHEADGPAHQYRARPGGGRTRVDPGARGEAAGGRRARCVGMGARRRRQSAARHGQRHRLAPCGLLFIVCGCRVPRRCAEEVVRALTGQRPLNVINAEVYAPGAARRGR